jgi:T-complex protein 1 subunit delta
VIPFTLAENAGLNPISIVTELRNRHANGEVNLVCSQLFYLVV